MDIIASRLFLVSGLLLGSSIVNLHLDFADWRQQPARSILQLSGHFGGNHEAIARFGNHAYIGDGSSLLVLDVRVPGRPLVIGRTPLPFPATDIAMSGRLMLVAAANLVVLDITNPAKPAITAIANVPAMWLSTEGHLVFVSARDCVIGVVDVSDPYHPLVRSPACTDGFAPPSTSLAIDDGYAFETVLPRHGMSNGSFLKITDIRNPLEPSYSGGIVLPGWATDVQVRNGVAYVLTPSALVLVNTTDPARPVELGRVSGPFQGGHIAFSDNLAVVAAEVLQMIDIDDPSRPSRSGSVLTSLPVSNLLISRDQVLAVGKVGLSIVSALQLEQPTELIAIPLVGVASKVVVNEMTAYLLSSDWLQVVNIAAPESPVVLGNIGLSNSPTALESTGTTLFVGTFSDVTVVDVSDPTKPTIRAHLPVTGPVDDLELVDPYLIVTHGYRDVLIVDTADPWTPRKVGSFVSKSWSAISSVEADGNLVYLLQQGVGMLVIDISDPSSPRQVGILATGYTPLLDLALRDRFAYVAGDCTDSMIVVDARQSDDPKRVMSGAGRSTTGQEVCFSQLRSVGNRIFGADSDGNLGVYDVSDPAYPRPLARLNTNYFFQMARPGSVAASHDTVLIVSSRGLLVADLIDLPFSVHLPRVGP